MTIDYLTHLSGSCLILSLKNKNMKQIERKKEIASSATGVLSGSQLVTDIVNSLKLIPKFQTVNFLQKHCTGELL